MARQTQLNIRLTPEEMERLESYAKSKGYTKSEIIRDYIKRLPKPHGGFNRRVALPPSSEDRGLPRSRSTIVRGGL